MSTCRPPAPRPARRRSGCRPGFCRRWRRNWAFRFTRRGWTRPRQPSPTQKPAKGGKIEEAARRLRYAVVPTNSCPKAAARALPHAVVLDAVATAHTLDDQAETVLGKFLRGAWTEGLAGISPKLESREESKARRARRNLAAIAGHETRAEVEAYLSALGQPWREDSSKPPFDVYAQSHPPRTAAAAGGLESAAPRASGADGRRWRTMRRHGGRRKWPGWLRN